MSEIFKNFLGFRNHKNEVNDRPDGLKELVTPIRGLTFAIKGKGTERMLEILTPPKDRVPILTEDRLRLFVVDPRLLSQIYGNGQNDPTYFYNQLKQLDKDGLGRGLMQGEINQIPIGNEPRAVIVRDVVRPYSNERRLNRDVTRFYIMPDGTVREIVIDQVVVCKPDIRNGYPLNVYLQDAKGLRLVPEGNQDTSIIPRVGENTFIMQECNPTLGIVSLSDTKPKIGALHEVYISKNQQDSEYPFNLEVSTIRLNDFGILHMLDSVITKERIFHLRIEESDAHGIKLGNVSIPLTGEPQRFSFQRNAMSIRAREFFALELGETIVLDDNGRQTEKKPCLLYLRGTDRGSYNTSLGNIEYSAGKSYKSEIEKEKAEEERIKQQKAEQSPDVRDLSPFSSGIRQSIGVMDPRQKQIR